MCVQLLFFLKRFMGDPLFPPHTQDSFHPVHVCMQKMTTEFQMNAIAPAIVLIKMQTGECQLGNKTIFLSYHLQSLSSSKN